MDKLTREIWFWTYRDKTMKNLEILYKYYPLIVRYRRSIAATLAGLGTLVALSLVVPGPGSQTKVLVATGPLSSGTTLTASDFTQKEIPNDASWNSLQSDPNEIVGRVLARSLAPNQPISSNDLVGSGLLSGLPETYVAVSIPVSASTDSSLLNVGNFIDVYGSTNDGSKYEIHICENCFDETLEFLKQKRKSILGTFSYPYSNDPLDGV